MTIKVVYDNDVVIFHDGRNLGAIDYDTFCLQVLSPRQFRRLERDPDVRVWDVRKLELVNALLS